MSVSSFDIRISDFAPYRSLDMTKGESALSFVMPTETTVDAEDLKSRVRELRRFL